MSQFKSYTRYVGDPPSWMDEEERTCRKTIVSEMADLMRQQHGGMSAPVVDLLARYVEGEFDDDQLKDEFDKAYRQRCN